MSLSLQYLPQVKEKIREEQKLKIGMIQYSTLLLLVFNLALACQSNARLTNANEWKEGSIWRTNSVLVPDSNYELVNWELKLVFLWPLT